MNDINNTIFKLIGNGQLNNETVQDIKDKLIEKYNEPFEISHLGARFGTYSNNSVTAYCYPVCNNKLIFTSILNRDRVHFSDDYYLRMICHEIEELLTEKFRKEKITANVRVLTFGIEKYEEKVSVQEFINKEKNVSFLAKIIVKNNCSRDLIEKIMDEIKEQYNNIELKGIFYILENNYYDEIVEQYSHIPSNEYVNIKNKEKIKEKIEIRIVENSLTK